MQDTGITHGDVTVAVLYEDPQGRLWAGTHERGLFHYDPTSDTFIHQELTSNRKGRHLRGAIGIQTDQDGDLWVIYDNRLLKLNPESGDFIDGGKWAQTIWSDPTGKLWIVGGSEVSTLNQETQTWGQRFLIPSDEDKNSFYAHPSEAGVWLRSAQALYWYSYTDSLLQLIYHDPNAHFSGHLAIEVVYQDRSGLLWMGRRGAVQQWDQTTHGLRRYRHNPNNPHSLNHNHVRSFLEDRKGVLWVSTHNGFNRLDPITEQITSFTRETHATQGFTGLTIGTLLEAPEDQIWVGSWEDGLFRFDTQQETFKHYLENRANPHSLNNNGIMVLTYDHVGVLWVGTWDGLHRFDALNDRFIRYVTNAASPKHRPSAGPIVALYEAPSQPGILWIGTVGGGLNRLDLKKDEITYILPDSQNPKGLAGSDVYAIHEDRDGQLWLATNAGLHQMDRTHNTFTRYTTAPVPAKAGNGLPTNTLYCIVEDNHRRLWIGTANGLVRFDKTAGTFDVFGTDDGLANNGHNWSGCYVRPQGTFLIGGRNGFTEFHPDSLRPNPILPKIALTDFQLAGTSIIPGNPLSDSLNAYLWC